MKISFQNPLISLFFICLSAITPLAAQSPDAGATVSESEPTIGTLILSDDSAIQVIELYEQLTGKIVLRRQDIPPAKINFNSRGSISQSEAILALESLLSLNGIMLTDVGGRFIKAVPANNVQQNTPVLLEGSTLELPPSQQIYTKFFRLNHLDAEESRDGVVAPLLSNQSHLVAFPKANALLVSDALLNLQRVEEMLQSLDQPQKYREQIEFIKLDYIQAQDMQQQLENLSKGPLARYFDGNTSITADERSNQLIVVTQPDNLATIKEVVKSIDIDAAPLTRSEVFQLRQAKAEDVVPIIENIISGQEEGREEDAKVTRNQNSNRDQNNNNNNKNTPKQAQVARAITPNSNEANSALQFSNFVGLSADTRTNSIVAYGTDSDLKSIGELINKIDIPLPQVRIEAIITEVSLDENQGSGIKSFELAFNDGSTRLTGSMSGVASNVVNSATPAAGAAETLLSTFGKFDLNAVLDLAEGDNNIRVLSTPSIVVSHNEEGIINVSQSRPFETGTTSFNNSSNNTQTQLEYRDVGIKLTTTPLIGADGSVQLQIEQTVDTVQNFAGNEETRPIIGKREANSTITVNDGDVIILGGLQENKKDVSNIYFPIVGRLPVFKQLLSHEDVEYTRTELIIFIRPTILKTPDEANEMSRKAIEGLKERKVVKEYLETGTTGDAYMEGSGFEDEKPKKPKLKNPKTRQYQ
ncbi:MAG: Type II secretion system protein D [Opitutia bacterium UBA7350]|nr:MAG: Type II secretion system protein D [Opitutae bacterium UBA7350]